MNRMMSSKSGLIPPPGPVGRRTGVACRRGERRVEREPELLCVALRDAQRDELQPGAVVPLPECGNRLTTDLARRRIGDEPFGTLAVSMRQCPCPSDEVSFGTRRMTTPALRDRSPIGAMLPTFQSRPMRSATSLGSRPPRSGSVTIGDLALRLVAHVLRDALHPGRRRRLDHVGEVVDESAGRRNLGTALVQHGRHRKERETATDSREHVLSLRTPTLRDITAEGFAMEEAHGGPDRFGSPAARLRR